MRERAILTQEERIRYDRQLQLPQLGEAGQERLKGISVLCVGAGGLGAPLLSYLAAAGIGRIGIVDPDRVSLSNLHRQLLYTDDDIGRLKVDRARDRLRRINPHLQIDTFPFALSSTNALRILADYDIIADGTDNFPTRYLVNDACVLAGKTNVYASVYQFEGQVAVFNQQQADGSYSVNYRNLYPTPPAPDAIPDCAEGGVLGVLPGIVGSLQAAEVIKLAAGIGEPLVNQLLLIDTLYPQPRLLRIPEQDPVAVTQLIDYEVFCDPTLREAVPDISPSAYRQQPDAYYLIDVRELDEQRRSNLGGQSMPLSQIDVWAHKLPQDRPIVLHCKTGRRSRRAILALRQKGVPGQLINLRGGLDAYLESC